eukprot:403367422
MSSNYMAHSQISPKNATAAPQNQLAVNKQILKDIKETLEREFSNIQQINQVIIKLSQKKDLQAHDIDAAREMMKINFKKNSLSITKNKRQDLSIDATVSQNDQKPHLLKSQAINLTLQDQNEIQHSNTLNVDGIKTLQLINKLRGNLSTNNRNKKKIVLPSLNGAKNSERNEMQALLSMNLGDMRNNQQDQKFRSTERSTEIVINQKLKQQDPWRLMINEDLNNYELDQQSKFKSKRNSQANYKEYLQQQIESTKAQKIFQSQMNLQEGERLQQILQKANIKEKERFSNYREKIKGIMDQNDNTKVNLLLQQQKLKMEQNEKEKREAIEKDLRDKQQIEDEIYQEKLKQRKVSSDLDFIKAQHNLVSQTLNGDGKSQYHSYTNKSSPRNGLSLDADLKNINPFVDKAGIIKHRSRIQELTARSNYNAQLFDKYTVSPKDNQITKLEQNTNFQTILDERNRKKYEDSKSLQKQYIIDNQNLSMQKSKAKIESYQTEVYHDLEVAKQDLQLSLSNQQQEILEKKQKQRYVQLTLQDQIYKNKDQKLKVIQGDLSPTELALNKHKLQGIEGLSVSGSPKQWQNEGSDSNNNRQVGGSQAIKAFKL